MPDDFVLRSGVPDLVLVDVVTPRRVSVLVERHGSPRNACERGRTQHPTARGDGVEEGSGLTLPPWRGVAHCWECRKLPGRCRCRHRVEEGIGEKKTKPKSELVRGPYGIDPLTPAQELPERAMPGTERSYTGRFTASFKKGGKSSFKAKSSELCR